jgi:hypothetical protein
MQPGRIADVANRWRRFVPPTPARESAASSRGNIMRAIGNSREAMART